MRKIFWLCFCLFMTFTFAAAQDGGLLTSIVNDAKFRDGPGTEWRWLGTVRAGTPIALDGRAPGGGWVRGIVPDGNVGWVIASAVAASADQINALPGVWVDVPFTLPAPAGSGGVEPASSIQQQALAEQQPAENASQPAEAPASVPLPEGGLQLTVGNNVNLRDNPSTSGGIIERLRTGTRVSADGRNAAQDWIRVATPTGAKGWVATRFINITAQQIASLPIVEGGASAAAAAPANAQSPGAAATPLPVVAVANTAPVRGFSYGGHAQSYAPTTVSAMQRAGMTWIKKQFRYFAGQSADAAAGVINEAHANGFRIVLGVVGSPSEVSNGGYFDQYAAFVGGVAALGADAIEVWNEPNIDREWPSGQIDPGRFTQLLAAAYRAIKAANPNTMVISGAPAPTGFFGGCSGNGCDDAAFMAGMASAGAANYMDCVGVHYNEGIVSPDQTSGDPRGNSGYYTRYFWGMVNTYYNAFRGARPLCFTELGYLTPEGFPPLPGGFAWAQNVTLAQQAAWLDRAIGLAASSGKVRLVIVWNVDFTSYGDDPMGGYAIIRPDGSCPACDALGR